VNPLTDGPLRILYHHRVAASDGMRVHITEVVGALRQLGHEVLVVGPAGAPGETTAGSSSRLEAMADRLRATLPGWAFEMLELAYNLPAYLRLRAAAKAFRPDVLYERYNLFLLAGLLLRSTRRLPMLLEINAPLAAERTSFGNLQMKGLARRCEALLWSRADAVLPVTEVLARDVRAARRAPGGVHVIANGGDPDHRPGAEALAAVRIRLGLAPDAVVMGFVGFVRAWHGVGWAVEALPALPPEVCLVVVGDGPALDQLRERADALGVGARVHLLGRTPHAEVPAIMLAFDVALQTAATPYASPLKLFEYMGLGRAIVAPDQANIREVLCDADDALLFAPDDQGAFTAAVQRLCADAGLRARLGAQAARTLRQRPFTWAGNAARIAVLGRALAAKAASAATRATNAPAPQIP
jgi:glycosyltransferase involved in cell wall biosynthesis